MILSQQQMPAEELVIINPRIEIWSGTVQVQRDTDLPAINGQLPPKGLVSDGRKQLICNEPLRPMHNIRKAIERWLKQDGFTGLVGTAICVTAEKANEFIAKLPEFEKDFEAAVDDLTKHLDHHYANQERIYPAWATMLASSRLTPAEVRSRCRFGVAVFRIAPPDPTNTASPANQLFQQMTREAVPTLLSDIASDATELLPRFHGKGSVKQSQLAPVRRLVGKLKGFSFLDPRIQPVAAGLESILESLPTIGPLDARDTALVLTILQPMANPGALLAHGIGVIAEQKRPPAAVQADLLEDTTLHPAEPAIPLHRPIPPSRQRNGLSVAL